MQLFSHNLYPRIQDFSSTTTEAGRVYHTPAGDFRSVTTIIGDKSDHRWLDEWRNRVGKDVADQISHQASTRGTAIHELAEKYVMNDPDWAKGAMPINVFNFKNIKKILDQDLEVVYGIEYPLYSALLKTAGRSDLPARFRGKDSIVDFKTSRRLKKREDITGYFVQSTAYALMFEEITGVKVPQIAVIITVDDEDRAQVFIEKTRTWYPEVKRIFCD